MTSDGPLAATRLTPWTPASCMWSPRTLTTLPPVGRACSRSCRRSFAVKACRRLEGAADRDGSAAAAGGRGAAASAAPGRIDGGAHADSWLAGPHLDACSASGPVPKRIFASGHGSDDAILPSGALSGDVRRTEIRASLRRQLGRAFVAKASGPSAVGYGEGRRASWRSGSSGRGLHSLRRGYQAPPVASSDN